MNLRGPRTSRRLMAAVAAIAGWGLALGFETASRQAPRAPEEFLRPEFSISSGNIKLEELRSDRLNAPAWSRFFAEHGKEFQVFIDPRSGAASNIVGSVPLVPGRGRGNRLTLKDVGSTLGRPVREVDSKVVEELLGAFVERNRDVLALDVSQLGTIRAEQVREDLWHVNIPQQAHGIPVRFGRLLATLSQGNLVLIGAETWGDVRISTDPQISPEDAMSVAFDYAGGTLPQDRLWKPPSLEILPYAPPEHQEGEAFAGPLGQGYAHRLAWVFGFQRPPELAMWECAVDAHTGALIAFNDTNQHASRRIVGGVYPLTSTEICPSAQQCGTMQPDYPMPFADTGFAPPNDFTNSAGLYDYSGGTLVTTLAGRYVRVSDGCGAISESSATGDLDLGGVNGEHDCATAGSSPGDTASSRSAFYELNKLIELARGWLPSNAWLQGQLLANVDLPQTCNAFYSPFDGTVNFYRSGGGCRNTGEIAAVFDHEWGHALDDNDTGGALSSSSEAYADIASILRLQASCVGHGFWQSVDNGCGMTADGTGFNANEDQIGGSHCDVDCSGVRDADWALHSDGVPDTPANHSCVRCFGGGGPCGRQVHCDAAPSRQAAWDFATRDLRAAPYDLDSGTAFIIANRIFYQGSGNIGSWHSCTCPGSSDGCGAGNAYMQWLAADDDNGNLNDGTPHMTALFNAFNRHGIACSAPTPTRSGCAGGPSVAPVLTVSPRSNQNALSWTSVPGATAYWVLRGEGHAGCEFGKALIATVAGTSYTDGDVANGRPYSYVVMAVGSPDACFGPASSCIAATPQPCAGAVSFDAPAYSCADTIDIALADSDLLGTGAQSVTLRSATETSPETVVLTESPASSGRFAGSFLTSAAPPAVGDGRISVVDGDTLTVRYVDASYCGTPGVVVDETAGVDCTEPLITNVQASNVTGSTADVAWTTDEASDSRVVYDTVTPPSVFSAFAPQRVVNHSVRLTGLAPCAPYFYLVQSTDPFGNSATNSSGGSYYTFTTGANTILTRDAMDVPVPIPDFDPFGAFSTVSVDEDVPVSDVEVRVNITHPSVGDIMLSLVGPDGTEIILSDRHGGFGANYTDTVFDDEAAAPISSGTPPFTGSFRPDQPLTAFDGGSSMGSWSLRVSSFPFPGASPALVGTIDGWSLKLTGPTQVCGPSLEFESSAPVDACYGLGGGGGNGTVEPGEEVILPVEAHNNGTAATTGVSATLSTSTAGVTIADGTAIYPDVPAGGSATSESPHFALRVDEALPCGTVINLTIDFTADQGSWTDAFTVKVGAPAPGVSTLPSSDVPKAVSRTPPATSILTVGDAPLIMDVDVTLTLSHPRDADLDIFLIGPNGARVELSTDNGGNGSDYTSTRFNDEAASPISAGTPPFTGAFRPEGSLSALDGISPGGTWTLEVADDSGAVSGTLVSWSITLTTSPCRYCAMTVGQVTQLVWTAGGKTSLQWGTAPGATQYKVYRGVPAALPDLLDSDPDSCLRATTSGLTTGAILTEAPTAGSFHWYLVRGSNGSVEGPAGSAFPAGPRIQNSSGACP